MKKQIKSGRGKKKGFLITTIMLFALIISILSLSGCGGCFSCLCPGCDGEPELSDNEVPALVLAMDHQGCAGGCLSCFGCDVLEYSSSETKSCLGCYDATYYGCRNCGAGTDDVDAASLKIDSSKIFCGNCYSISISDNNHAYSQGCLTK